MKTTRTFLSEIHFTTNILFAHALYCMWLTAVKVTFTLTLSQREYTTEVSIGEIVPECGNNKPFIFKISFFFHVNIDLMTFQKSFLGFS